MAQELSTSTLITWECPVVKPGSNSPLSLSLSPPFRWQPHEEASEGATKLNKDDKTEIKSEGSWSTSLIPRPCSLHRHYHRNHRPPPLRSCCSSFLRALGGCSELERGCVLPLLETPLNHRPERGRTAVRRSRPADSWCPPHLCLRGSTEPSREKVGWQNPTWPLWLLMPYYWMLTMNLPCLSACLSNGLSFMCLSVTSAVNLHQVP